MLSSQKEGSEFNAIEFECNRWEYGLIFPAMIQNKEFAMQQSRYRYVQWLNIQVYQLLFLPKVLNTHSLLLLIIWTISIALFGFVFLVHVICQSLYTVKSKSKYKTCTAFAIPLCISPGNLNDTVCKDNTRYPTANGKYVRKFEIQIVSVHLGKCMLGKRVQQSNFRVKNMKNITIIHVKNVTIRAIKESFTLHWFC